MSGTFALTACSSSSELFFGWFNARQPGSGSRAELPLTQFPGMAVPRPHSVAWVKAERGHAVLATEPAGADAATQT